MGEDQDCSPRVLDQPRGENVAAANAAAFAAASLGVDALSARTAVKDDATGSAPSAREVKQAIKAILTE